MTNDSQLKIRCLDSDSDDFASELQALLQPPAEEEVIRNIVADMRSEIEQNGDDALLAMSERFDNFRPQTAQGLEVEDTRLQQACADIPPPLLDDLHTAARRLREYHKRQLPKNWDYLDEHGNRLGEIINPVERAVVYAPGGTAAYPSSVLMGVVPAKVAGVEEVILTTPAPKGVIPAITLAAAAVAGCDRVFMLGGAQAILGFALGSETLPPADVIVGPGNAYVTEAKRQVMGDVGIDSLAGPSEVLIISDGSAPAAWVAADLAAQAEHGNTAQSILLSTDAAHIKAVFSELAALLPTLPRADIIRTSLNERGICILAATLEDCCQIANDIAPEHLQVMTADAEKTAANITHAGGIFIGNYGSVPFGDYLAGTNHVLPTAGTARFSSPLGVEHFIKRSGVFYASADGANALAAAVGRLADAEGFLAHAHSARLRQKDD